jgi:hypothetical protein
MTIQFVEIKLFPDHPTISSFIYPIHVCCPASFLIRSFSFIDSCDPDPEGEKKDFPHAVLFLSLLQLNAFSGHQTKKE